MAISEDTAALVAAQLTGAWAVRVGANPPRTEAQRDAREAQILAQYHTFYRCALAGLPEETINQG